MIGARQILAQVLTVPALNAQIDALNTRFGSEVPHLPSNTADPAQHGVQDMWAKTYRQLTRPGLGYMIGILRQGRTELRRAGKNRMTMPVWVDIQSEPTDSDTAVDQVGLYFQALMYVMEQAESDHVAVPNVSPPFTLVHITEPVQYETLVGDAAAAGRILLVRSQWELVFDDARA